MTANPPLRAAIWLGFTAVAGVGGWAGGRAAREGLNPDGRTARHLSSLQPTVAGPREPRVEPGTAEGNWMARVKAADSSDFAALLEELDTLLPREGRFSEREAAQKWLLALWISKDADAAVACVAGKQDKFLSSTFGLLLGSVAPEKVAAILAGPFKNDLGEYFPSAALHSLATADPREFLKLQSDKNAGGSPWIRNWPRALAALAESDPSAAAAAWNAAGTNEPSRNSSLFSILRIWTEHDVKGARQWAEGLTDEKDRQLARHAWLGTLARRDPRAALKELAGMDAGEFIRNAGGSSLSDARVEIVTALAKQSLPEAVAALRELEKTADPAPAGATDVDLHGKMREAIAKAAALVMPHEPGQFLIGLKRLGQWPALDEDPRMYRAPLDLQVLRERAATWDAEKAMEAVALVAADTSLTSGDQMKQALIESAVASSPEHAVSGLARLPVEWKGEAAALMLSALHQVSAETLLFIAPFVPAEQWSAVSVDELAEHPSETAPFMTSLPDNEQTAQARLVFAAKWASLDPEATAQWVLTQPAGDSAQEAAHGLTVTWARFDDGAASAWAAAQGEGPVHDGAAGGLAAGMATTDREAAFRWASSISDAPKAVESFLNLALHWGYEAPPEFRAAYAAALDRAGHTAEEKADALNRLDKPPAIPAKNPEP